jgi:hypothetical protein
MWIIWIHESTNRSLFFRGPFSTIWIPAVSLKAARLGFARLQRCPIHHKWELVKRVDPDTLTTQERTAAESIRDIGIPSLYPPGQLGNGEHVIPSNPVVNVAHGDG